MSILVRGSSGGYNKSKYFYSIKSYNLSNTELKSGTYVYGNCTITPDTDIDIISDGYIINKTGLYSITGNYYTIIYDKEILYVKCIDNVNSVFIKNPPKTSGGKFSVTITNDLLYYIANVNNYYINLYSYNESTWTLLQNKIRVSYTDSQTLSSLNNELYILDGLDVNKRKYGLTKYNLDNNTFTTILNSEDDPPSIYISKIFNHNNKIWTRTSDEFMIYNENDNIFTKISYSIGDTTDFDYDYSMFISNGIKIYGLSSNNLKVLDTESLSLTDVSLDGTELNGADFGSYSANVCSNINTNTIHIVSGDNKTNFFGHCNYTYHIITNDNNIVKISDNITKSNQLINGSTCIYKDNMYIIAPYYYFSSYYTDFGKSLLINAMRIYVKKGWKINNKIINEDGVYNIVLYNKDNIIIEY